MGRDKSKDEEIHRQVAKASRAAKANMDAKDEQYAKMEKEYEERLRNNNS